ncbi:MAG TPA: YncE family protein [Vineibacter sp.]|nr:YncE family protein [Vineibacter sp.]
MHKPALAIALTATLGGLALPAAAQLAVSSNDRKLVLDNGTAKVVANPKPDTATIIDLGVFPPKVLAEIEVPGSVVGPPTSVAVAADGSTAYVASAMKIDAKDATKQEPDDRISIIDLKAKPPKVVGTITAGKSPAGLSITADGKMLLVANRSEGSVSMFALGTTPREVAKLTVGKDTSLPSHVAITPDGKTALVTMNGEHTVKVLKIDGEKLEDTKREISTGVRPYPIAIHPSGKMAIVANVGRGTGDSDTVNVIDLSKTPARTVGWIDLGYETAEGMMLSPDGRWCGVVVMNGSNKAKESPFFNPAGRLLLYRVDGLKLTKVAEAPIGRWSQGIAFSKDGRTILVQNMVEENAMVFRWDGAKLVDTKQPIKLGGGGAAIRTAGSL